MYSLGVCAYQFLTGRLPHEYSSLTELALKQQRDTVVPITDFRSDVTPELDRAIRVALERDPSQRYASALDMAAALDAGARGDDTAATQAFMAGTGTQLLGGGIDDTGATQALPATRAPRQPTAPVAPPARTDRERDRQRAREQKSSGGGNRAKLVALALVLILAAVAVAILVSGTSGSGFTDINAGSPRDQAQEIINYIKAHRQ
jgi:serine/threonine-protein kinase